MRDALRLSLPLTGWLIAFSALYGLHAVVCEVPGGAAWGRAALLAAAAAAVLVQAGALWLLAATRAGGPPGFVRAISLALAGVALVATVWTLLPVTFMPLCVL